MGAVPQLFRNHLVPFKQTEGIVIFVLIDKYIHSRDITDISAHHGRHVFIMQNRRNALILQGTLNNMCLKASSQVISFTVFIFYVYMKQ